MINVQDIYWYAIYVSVSKITSVTKNPSLKKAKITVS
jgi:hypothetical protein